MFLYIDRDAREKKSSFDGNSDVSDALRDDSFVRISTRNFAVSRAIRKSVVIKKESGTTVIVTVRLEVMGEID